MISVSEERMRELLHCELELDALKQAGVDNWCGHEDAMEFLDEYEEERELDDDY